MIVLMWQRKVMRAYSTCFSTLPPCLHVYPHVTIGCRGSTLALYNTLWPALTRIHTCIYGVTLAYMYIKGAAAFSQGSREPLQFFTILSFIRNFISIR